MAQLPCVQDSKPFAVGRGKLFSLMNWFYVEAGKQAGPVEEGRLQELLDSGVITPETLVWREGMANWQRIAEVKPELVAAAPVGGAFAAESLVTDEVVCAECHGRFRKQDTVAFGPTRVCAACKPVFLQKLREGAPVRTGAVRYAGFWIRVGAKLLDGLILGIFFLVPMFYFAFRSAEEPGRFEVLQLVFQLVYMVANIAYNVFFIGKYGATPGKMACGLRVIVADGNRVSYGRATGRAFAEILSGMICYIGYIIVAFDSQKRALHDHICNTRVIYK